MLDLALPDAIASTPKLRPHRKPVRLHRYSIDHVGAVRRGGEPLSGGARSFWANTSRPQEYRARFRIRKPDGTTGASLLFSITVNTSSDGSSVTESGADETGFLTFESQTDMKSRSGSYGFRRKRLVGTSVVDALPSIEFLQELQFPNVLQASWAQGPFVDYHEVPKNKPAFPPDVMEYLRALAALQPYSKKRIFIPDLTTVTDQEIDPVLEAAELVAGNAVDRTWTPFTWVQPVAEDSSDEAGGDANVTSEATSELDLASHYQLLIKEPLIIAVGGEEHTLGTVHSYLLSVRFRDEGGKLRVLPYGDNTMRRIFAPKDLPVPSRSHRPVLVKLLGPLNDDAIVSHDLPPDDSEQVSDSPFVHEIHRKVLMDGLRGPVPLGLIHWHARHEDWRASLAEVQERTLATIRSLVRDGLCQIGHVRGKGRRFMPLKDPLEGSLKKIERAYVGGYENKSRWESAFWLKLTELGESQARDSADALSLEVHTPRRRLHALGAARSGYADTSMRVDEILAEEVGK